MWRAFFLAMGTCFLLIGAQCLAVDRFVFKSRLPPPPKESLLSLTGETELGPHREIKTPEWAPYILMSTGAIVCLYSFTVPRRMKTK
ncbi:MAG: hypothetical protein ABSH20_28645 [Tepidisphaeraceae bacterium]